tara:strand:+ start:298 stop:1647 length:1350 start_codon:yes stop_codon:yes gene_type:complete
MLKKPINFKQLRVNSPSYSDRYKVYENVRSPFIYLIDNYETNKRFSLKGLHHSNKEDCATALQILEVIGNNDFPFHLTIEELVKKIKDNEPLILNENSGYDWETIKVIVNKHLVQTMKGSSARNMFSTLNRITKDKPVFEWSAILQWLKKYHSVEERGFRNNLDGIEQIRLALNNQDGFEPEWLKKENLIEQRLLHNQAKSKLNRYASTSDLGDIRGIPTKKEAEKYLNEIKDEFPLQHWCLAMMLLYGLRNHELHHIEEITSDEPEKGNLYGWVYVAGSWRTKSKFEHWTFPLYPEWIEKYQLKENFRKYQDELRKKAQMKIVSSLDKTKKWDGKNPKDQGVCDNNEYLGNWITKQLKNNLPTWKARIPDARGIENKEDKPQPIRPYDLRHTWAIRLATEKRWADVSDSDAAQAMGHDVATHRKHYQRWISSEAIKRKQMDKISLTKR